MLTFDRNDPYHRLFWEESLEQISALESDLLHLEKHPKDSNCLQSLFRNAHSLKGSSATMELSDITHITHDMETLFDTARKADAPLDKKDVFHLFKLLDQVKILHQGLLSNTGLPKSSCSEGSWLKVSFTPGSDFLAIKAFQILRALSAHSGAIETHPPDPEHIEDDTLFKDQLTIHLETPLTLQVVEDALMPISDIDTIELSTTIEALTAEDKPASDVTSGNLQGVTSGEVESSSIKISSATVDQLINLVTELTLEHNALAAISKQLSASDLEYGLALGLGSTIRRLQARLEGADQLLKSIQHIALSARMLPVSTLFGELPRMARDLANQLGKSVNLTLEGEHYKLDKTVLLALRDPINHLIRNAIDHGIETTSQRSLMGKNPVGNIHLSASQSQDSLIVTLSDDGGGINIQEIQNVAFKKGIVSLEESSFFTHEDWHNLLFHSGFSTKTQTSQISGRGVGLDVVKSNLTAIHGNIQIFSERTIGTTFVLKLPISIAISKHLILMHNNFQIGIPVAAIQGIYSIKGNQFATSFHITEHSCTYIWQDLHIPVYDILTRRRPEEPEWLQKQYLIILAAASELFSVLVDDLCYEEELVALPLAQYKKINGLLTSDSHITSGAILGNGSICFCFDLSAIPNNSPDHNHQEDLCAF